MRSPPPETDSHAERGFTLIELSIVLVIIGLIVGGILVGRELITAASVRMQIAQIDKIRQGVNAFKLKTGYLPGDIREPEATMFGLVPRGPYPGEGDGNGYVEGVASHGPTSNHYGHQATGESAMFWADLSAMKYIDNNLTTASPTTPPSSAISGTRLDLYYPQGTIRKGNYIYAYSKITAAFPDKLYFGMSAISSVATGGLISSGFGLTVAEAYSMDTKIDDARPHTGRVITKILNYDYVGGAGTWMWTNSVYTDGNTLATAPSSATCADNANLTSSNFVYTTTVNGGSGLNCGLSFQY